MPWLLLHPFFFGLAVLSAWSAPVPRHEAEIVSLTVFRRRRALQDRHTTASAAQLGIRVSHLAEIVRVTT